MSATDPVRPRERRAIRAGDAERETATSALRGHHAEGRLTNEELDGRVGAACHARTVGELEDLLADLPSSDVVRGSDRGRGLTLSGVGRLPLVVAVIGVVWILGVIGSVAGDTGVGPGHHPPFVFPLVLVVLVWAVLHRRGRVG